MAKSPKNKYVKVLGKKFPAEPDGKASTPYETMTQPTGHDSGRMLSKFGEETSVSEALKDRRFLANKKPVKTPSWRKPNSPLTKWQDRVNKAVDDMTQTPEPEVKNEQTEYDKFGHVTKHPKSAKETLTKRFRLGRAKHTPHPAPIRGAEYKQTPQMERPHYEETDMTDNKEAVKTFSQFVKEAKKAKDEDESEGGAKHHIMMQMRQAISMRGQHPVTFKDGKKVKVTPEIAHRVLAMHDNMRRPSEKEEFAAHVGKSLDHLKSGLKGNWKAEEKPRVTLAGPKLRKESTLSRVAKAVVDGVAPVAMTATVPGQLATAGLALTSSPANKGEPDYVKQNVAKQKAKDTNRDKMMNKVSEGAVGVQVLPNLDHIEEGKSSMAKPKFYSDTMKKATKFSDTNIAKMMRDEKARKAAENKDMKGKKVDEDYAPLEKGEVHKHPDDAPSPKPSAKKKQGADKPVALKDPAKYTMKEALEYYDSLSDEDRAFFETMTLDEIVDFLNTNEEQ